MSYEAWGDDDDGLDGVRDSMMDAGWLTPDDADELRAAIFKASWERMCLFVMVSRLTDDHDLYLRGHAIFMSMAMIDSHRTDGG